MQKGIGMAIFLCFLSTFNKNRIKKKATAIGDMDILGNLIPTSYIQIRILNAQKIGLTTMFLAGKSILQNQIEDLNFEN